MANIRVTCPTCKSELEIDDQFVGQEVECGSCLQVFVAQPPTRGRGPGASRGRDDEEAGEERPRRRRRPRRDDDDDDDDYEFDRRRYEEDEDDYFGPPRRSGEGTGLALTSMILGILAIFPGCCCGLLGVPLSIAAIVTGSIGMKNPEGKGMAIAGIVLGVVGLAFIVLAIILNVGMNGANRFK